jgi:hypothetical protein
MLKTIAFTMMILGGFNLISLGQNAAEFINDREARSIVSILAADSLKGRGNGSKELLHAGMFIGKEFLKIGLQRLPGNHSYFHAFRPFGGSKQIISEELTWNGQKLLPGQFIYFHSIPGAYPKRSLNDFTVVRIDSFFTPAILEKYKDRKQDILLWTNLPQPDLENYFPSTFIFPEGFDQNILMVCAKGSPESIELKTLASYYSNVEYNVTGMIPGKTKPEEIILFSAHYDHEGVFRRGPKKDSILNGANDNASGVAALLMLAKYFRARNDNERTILFCAFAGEELGLKGSADFVANFDVSRIVAGINIEMIGVAGYGKNGIFITGRDSSSLPAILEKGFSTTPVKIKRGPSEQSKELFHRSDNYPFVEKGIPAHSIMSSDDDDKCYHQPCDEIKRIDFSHLAVIVRGIAIATKALVSGESTPSRTYSRN